MQFNTCHIPSIILVDLQLHGDERGFFMETFRENTFQENGIPNRFLQDNCSRSGKHILRGMHYQIEHPQGHLVWVTQGKIFDVGVDLRLHSPTFGKWFGITLSADKPQRLYLPPGIAHGFCTLANINDIHYKCTDYYNADDEHGLNWNDPTVGIHWPISKPNLNLRDTHFPFLTDIP